MSTTAIRPAPAAAHVHARSVAGVAGWLQPLRYWHLLSLDAPTVAATWMLAFCVGSGARQHAVQAATLALAVWLLYVADRLLDARNGWESLEARHRFHARHWRKFVCVAACVAVVVTLLLYHLAAPVRSGWLWLSLPLAGYALVVHLGCSAKVPKEVFVALLFALATALPMAILGSHPAGVYGTAALFAGLCWLNCTAIARWEHATARGVPTWTPAQFRAVCVGFGLAAVFAARWLPPLPALAIGVSAVLLCTLDGLSRRLEAVALRALVDAAMLTPLVLLALVR